MILVSSCLAGLEVRYNGTHSLDNKIRKLIKENKAITVYGILALIAVIMMFVPKKGIDDIPLEKVIFNKWLAALFAFIVGIGAIFYFSLLNSILTIHWQY